MKKAVTKLLGVASVILLSTGPAFAYVQAVPEIDAGQGLAAIAVVLCVAMILREKFLREHSAKA